MTPPNPANVDLEAFADAQRRLRATMGEPVTFFGEAQVTFAPGVALDPETGEPYDPRIQPVDSFVPSASAVCNVAWRIVLGRGSGAEARDSAMGEFDFTHVVLITDAELGPLLDPMVRFKLRGDDWLISTQKDDAAWMKRWVVYGRKEFDST